MEYNQPSEIVKDVNFGDIANKKIEKRGGTAKDPALSSEGTKRSLIKDQSLDDQVKLMGDPKKKETSVTPKKKDVKTPTPKKSANGHTKGPLWGWSIDDPQK